MKQISSQQIDSILETVYTTNIPAKTFDLLRNLLLSLPDVIQDIKTEPVAEEFTENEPKKSISSIFKKKK